MLIPQSLTSNEVKLLKHLDVLQAIQEGEARPVTLHVAPTNRCNLRCGHCCFAERDHGHELAPDTLRATLKGLAGLGLKSVEFTGGGEPALWPHLGEAVGWVTELYGLDAGICTNGTVPSPWVPWDLFSWVRVSLNPLDDPEHRLGWYRTFEKIYAEQADVSGCYVVTSRSTAADFRRVFDVAETWGLQVRLAPESRGGLAAIGALLRLAERAVDELGAPKGVFVSGFNAPRGARDDQRCWMHLVKPFLAADGWLYSCPSAELSPEHPADVVPAIRLCRGEDAARFYRAGAGALERPCAVCKYEAQNALISMVTAETRHNAFC